MQRICCFTETWASGGIESFLTRTLSCMDRDDLRIDLVTTQINKSVFTNELTRTGIRLIPLSGSKSNWLSNCRRFRQILNENHYDIIHLNAFQGLQLVYLYIAKRAGVPVRIAHSHGSDLRKSPLRPAKLLLHRMGQHLFGKSATHHLACSAQAAAFLFGVNMPFQFIPNGIDTDRFRFRTEDRDRVREELGLAEKFVIASVGRLQNGKNHTFLLDVIKILVKQRSNAVLLLVGEGEERDTLARKAAALGIDDHVLFYGTSNRVEELLWCADTFVFSSLSEGLGLVAVEAQAAGLPTLCSPFIPLEANVTDLFHSLPLDSADWADALTKISSTEREQYADTVKNAGFDSRTAAALIHSFYTNTTH